MTTKKKKNQDLACKTNTIVNKNNLSDEVEMLYDTLLRTEKNPRHYHLKMRGFKPHQFICRKDGWSGIFRVPNSNDDMKSIAVQLIESTYADEKGDAVMLVKIAGVRDD